MRFAGKNIHDVLEMTVAESLEFFEKIAPDNPAPGCAWRARSGARTGCSRSIRRSFKLSLSALRILCEVGLGYLRLGQPLNTLSGGEAQRLKLVGHLVERERNPSTKGALLIFDEPTTGLHFDDVALLVQVFQRLVEQGDSLLVIEHNLEVIKCADYIVDLGPEAGVDGGNLVAVGTPEEVARSPPRTPATTCARCCTARATRRSSPSTAWPWSRPPSLYRNGENSPRACAPPRCPRARPRTISTRAGGVAPLPATRNSHPPATARRQFASAARESTI